MTARRVVASLAMLLAIALAIVACGQPSTPSLPGTTSAVPAAATAATSSPLPAVASPTASGPASTPVATGQAQRPTAPSSAPTERATASPAQSRPVDRIAYVGLDNQIYTVAPDGTSVRRITPAPATTGAAPAAYTWPTWSPDGRSLVISAAVPNPQSRTGRLVVYLADESAPERGLQAIHQDRAGSEGILPGVFHYALWAPDGEQVALIGVGQTDLATFIASLDGRPARPIIGGSPMYLTWSWDSARIYVHQSERLMMFDLASGDPAKSLGASTRYQSPVAGMGPGGRVAYVVDEGGGTGEIVVSETDGSNRRSIAGVPHLAAIQWAPDGRRLAIGRTLDRTGSAGDPFSYGQLLVVDSETRAAQVELSRPVFAFEWSPDGRLILIVERDADDPGIFSFSVLDVESGSVRELVRMQPTDEFGLMLVYFDQYAQSHRLWAPDGHHFVIAGQVQGGPAGEATEPADEKIWVIDATGQEPPKAVAEGYLAFWSPR